MRRASVRWGSLLEAQHAEKQSDYWTNIVPQHASFHNDEWKAVEQSVLRVVRNRADNKRAIVISGVWFDERNIIFDERAGASSKEMRIVPNAYWKTAVYLIGEELRSLHFWVPHNSTTTSSVQDMLRSVDAQKFLVDRDFIKKRTRLEYDSTWRIKNRRPTV